MDCHGIYLQRPGNRSQAMAFLPKSHHDGMSLFPCQVPAIRIQRARQLGGFILIRHVNDIYAVTHAEGVRHSGAVVAIQNAAMLIFHHGDEHAKPLDAGPERSVYFWW
jgi:hypothetical protein